MTAIGVEFIANGLKQIFPGAFLKKQKRK